MTVVIDVHDRELDDRLVRRTAAQQRRLAQTAQGLAELLEKRPDLEVVCPWARFAVDGVRWSV